VSDATALAASFRAGECSAVSLVGDALDRIARHDPVLNCFTHLRTEAALADAAALDAARNRGAALGPLAGVPFAVKNLFDVAGDTTIAGSRLLADAPPAARDATIVSRLREAGAVLLGQLNMDEFAYGFSTENSHYGDTANPHDPERIAGGSSGGSAAAVAAGLVPLSLGSDTNGSIRVPASLCGVFGCKPTYGRLSRAGTFPFVHSLDHVGPFSRSVRDLSLAYDLMQGPDARDPAQAARGREPTGPGLDDPPQRLRVGVLGGWFADGASDTALAAVAAVADGLARAGATIEPVLLADAEVARSAAFCLTGAEGGTLHLPWLREQAHRYDPAVRDRLIAGAMIPSAVVLQAQRVRSHVRAQAAQLFERVDLLLAPATPFPAVKRGEATILLDGRPVSARANMGLYAQPISFIGLPVVTVPFHPDGEPLPIGVQLIARPWAEALAFQAARLLERDGIATCRTLAYD
jgi:AtzE family amidohydrolase